MRIAPIALALAIFSAFPVKADVERQGMIDAIATKPESQQALLLLQQQKPWTEGREELLKTKLDFYVAAIKTGSLVEQRPALAGKTFRIIVLYSKAPPQNTLDHLEAKKAELGTSSISLVWGQDPVALASQP